MPFANDLFELAKTHLGLAGALVVVVCALAVFAFFQHQRARLLQERIDLEVERRKATTEELLRAKEQNDALPTKKDAATALPSAGAARHRLLLVDDDEICRMVWAQKLGIAYDIRTGADGLEALEQMRDFKPDVVVLDLMMPRMTGWDVLKHLQDARSVQRVVVYTGFAASPSNAPVDPTKLPNVSVVSKSDSESQLLASIEAQLRLLEASK